MKTLSELYFTFVGMDVYDSKKTNIGRVKHVYLPNDEPTKHPELAAELNNIKAHSSKTYSSLIEQGFIHVVRDEPKQAYIVTDKQIAKVNEKSVYIKVFADSLLVC